MLLHGASDLDRRCLKTYRSAVVAFLGGSHQISLPLPPKLLQKLHFRGPFNANLLQTGHSTETALLEMLNDVYTAGDDRRLTVAIRPRPLSRAAATFPAGANQIRLASRRADQNSAYGSEKLFRRRRRRNSARRRERVSDVLHLANYRCSVCNRECKSPTTPKFETKMVRDSNWDFRINLDPDVRRVRPKIVDALSRRHQSLRQVWYKSAVE